MSISRKFLFLSLASLGLTHARAQSLISNGDFESPAISPGYQTLAPSGWQWTGALEGVLVHGSPAFFPPPASGTQYLDLGPSSQFTISQAFTVSTPGDYVLTWLDNAAQQYSPETPYQVQILPAGAGASVLSDILSPTLDVWTPRSESVPLAPGDYTLAFTPTSPSTSWGAERLLDNVSLTARVPDGGLTIGMLGFAMVASTFIRRQLRRQD